jgi:hypothetical protein
MENKVKFKKLIFPKKKVLRATDTISGLAAATTVCTLPDSTKSSNSLTGAIPYPSI